MFDQRKMSGQTPQLSLCNHQETSRTAIGFNAHMCSVRITKCLLNDASI
jgi:hypothetical protein